VGRCCRLEIHSPSHRQSTLQQEVWRDTLIHRSAWATAGSGKLACMESPLQTQCTPSHSCFPPEVSSSKAYVSRDVVSSLSLQLLQCRPGLYLNTPWQLSITAPSTNTHLWLTLAGLPSWTHCLSDVCQVSYWVMEEEASHKKVNA
jgi:hypothetical protein